MKTYPDSETAPPKSRKTSTKKTPRSQRVIEMEILTKMEELRSLLIDSLQKGGNNEIMARF